MAWATQSNCEFGTERPQIFLHIPATREIAQEEEELGEQIKAKPGTQMEGMFLLLL